MDRKIHLTYFDLALDNNKTEYQNGDRVSGLIKIKLNGCLPLDQLRICLTCMAEVNWVESPGTRYHRTGHVYHDKRNLMEYVFAIPDTHNYLEAGEHEIPFTFKLPKKDIPSSFRSSHGSVTYYLEAVINELAINEVHRIGTEIVVDAPITQNLKLSIGNTVEKDFGLISCASGKIILHASLSKKGFFPGERIELHIEIINESSVEATPRATLIQRQIYMSGERHKAIDELLGDPIVGKTVDQNTELAETLWLWVPKLVSLTIKSGIVNIKYFIHVTLDIPHAFDIHVNLPIVITNESALRDN